MGSAALSRAFSFSETFGAPGKMNPSGGRRSLSRGVSRSSPAQPKPAMTAQRLRTVLPAVWELMRPRRGLLALGFLLMIINRVSGLVLPYSTKFLIDSVINQHHIEALRWLVLLVLAATLVQGITSFSLTQLLSKAAQRLITELREQVQVHISRLPVAFYDGNK